MKDGLDVLVADEAQWNSFFSRSANPVPFSSAQWRNAVCDLFNHSADYLLVIRKGEIVCGTIVYYAKGKTKFAKHPLLTPYNTLLLSHELNSDAEGRKAIKSLLDFIREKYFFPYFVFDTAATPVYTDVTGWNSSFGNTFLVDPANTVLDNDIVRRSRRCEEEGFYVKFSFDPHAFCRLYMQTITRQHIAFTPDEGKLIRFLEAINSAGFTWMASCFDPSGRLHASWVQIGLNDVLYNWNAASDSSLMNKGGTSFLVTQMLGEIKKKYKLWDLCGADIPSVAKFKRGIGGKLVTYRQVFYNNYSLIEKVGLRIKRHFNPDP